ncbi:Allantoicase [Westerdykella ornata]|uniref:Allantoicase n=1 Tax=Westerdykella ornata TaxID=318751 RepID=A0A6A6JGU6_WESOR|nr:Allantoicase [Westerdykella ornata]KAF2274856.1 Allantoicase [Westerdykella ornata]
MEMPAGSLDEVKQSLKGEEDSRRIPAEEIDATFKSKYTDLISAPLGSTVLSFSDEWFASASNLLTPTPPIRKPGYFVHTGAWYDGWETRRHNPEPFDWVVIRLGVASGRVAGVEIDTAWFNGNHAPEIAVQGAFIDNDEDEERVKSKEFDKWEMILSRKKCGPSQRHGWLLNTPTSKAYTHVRLQMFPDGGIARFRLYGTAVPVFPADADAVIELSATVNGGVATACSDQHFGTKDNLLLPGRGKDMGEGWETKRSRGAHVDWVIVKLGARCEIDHIVIDTAHFRGNYPQKVQVFAGDFEGEPGSEEQGWTEVLAPTQSAADVVRVYRKEGTGQEADGVLKEVRGNVYGWCKLVIIPDGGVSRFKVFGRRVV